MKDVELSTVEHLLGALETAWSRNDIDGLLAVFTPDATLESPLVARFFNRKDGVCRGQDELRELARMFMSRGRPWGNHAPPLIRGNTVAIEYLRAGSDDEQFSVDIIELRDGKIHSLRAYVGWRALSAIDGHGVP